MAEARRPIHFVIDASVSVKWRLLDEHDVIAADAILRDLLADRIRLLAQEHIRFEVPNALRRAQRTGRLPAVEARPAVKESLTWGIQPFASDELVLSAFDMSSNLGCSFNDGLHVALAHATQCPLTYADARLRNALGDRFPLAIWIADYESAPIGR
ncbi:MAG: type II toxin-antitoxin system VapC family toxin [Chloroflexia bacterium]|nr:type II toxin-antitoxin system VapC family toxin [Chloroflexia bacterium]